MAGQIMSSTYHCCWKIKQSDQLSPSNSWHNNVVLKKTAQLTQSKTIESIDSWKKRGICPGVAGRMNASWPCWGWANDQSPIYTVCWRFICAVLSWLLWTEVWMVLFGSWTSHEELTRYECHCTVVLGAKSSRHPACSKMVLKATSTVTGLLTDYIPTLDLGCKGFCCCEIRSV